MPFPDYDIVAETANAAVREGKLHREIEELSFSVSVFQGLVSDGTVVTVLFDTDPTSGEQVLVTNVVATHEGIPDPRFKLHATVTVMSQFIPSTLGDLGGDVTSVGSLIADAPKAIWQVVGQIKTNGTAKLIITKGDSTQLSEEYEHPDTSDLWEEFSLQTDQPLVLQQSTYLLRGELGTATSAEIRFTSMNLLEKI